MNTTNSNNTPAFPVYIAQTEKGFLREGMSLVDYFAAHALQGLLSAPSDTISQDSGPNARANPEKAAEWAYQYAEAMIKFREHIKWT